MSWHCGYCHARNPDDSPTCDGCGSAAELVKSAILPSTPRCPRCRLPVHRVPGGEGMRLMALGLTAEGWILVDHVCKPRAARAGTVAHPN